MINTSSENTALVVFLPMGALVRVPVGISVVEASRRAGLDLEALCGEQGVCGKCLVRIETGRFDDIGLESIGENAGPWSDVEARFINPARREAGYRLGCAARVQGDLAVFIPEESRTGRQVISKAPGALAIQPDPAVKSYVVTTRPPTLENQADDFTRVKKALASTYRLEIETIDLKALRDLPQALKQGDGTITAAVFQDREIIRVRPGRNDPGLGLAVDLGTTTIAAYLSRLDDGTTVGTASMMNPQSSFGEDVMSRITFCLDGSDGLDRMNRAAADGINLLIKEALTAGSEKLGRTFAPDDIEDMALCGNTAMQHIFLGLDPSSLGSVPFSPVLRKGSVFKARDLGIKINPSANLFVAPAVSGFVGGDAVCAALAEDLSGDDHITLLIDIGTNGEIILGNKSRLISASCATGPALEGAQVEFGMRAAPGAIERVRIDPETLEVDYKVVGRDAWRSYSRPDRMKTRGICGSGIIDALAQFRLTGIIMPGGAFDRKCASPRLRQNPDTGIKEFVLAWAEETAIGRDVCVTLKDIRQVQLAKAALYTGCKLLLRKWGADRPDRIKIAGAFGFHIDRELALAVGLFPQVPLESVLSVGNAAGDGCRLALLNRGKRDEADRIAARTEHLELNLEDGFQDELVAAIYIPHMKDF